MQLEFSDWITKNVTEILATCAEVTLQMQEVFPELTRVRGHYYDFAWGRRGHWWLVDSDGTVVDPTAAQFPSQGTGEYEPWEEGAPEPTGKCMNCGDYAYDNKGACSPECNKILEAEYGCSFE